MFLEFDSKTESGFRPKSIADLPKGSMQIFTEARRLRRAVFFSAGLNLALLITSIVLLVLFIKSGSQQPAPTVQTSTNTLRVGQQFCDPLYDEKGFGITGSVCVSVTDSNIQLTLASLDSTVTLNSTRIWAGNDLSAMPRTTSGDPSVDAFPYHDVTSLQVPLSSLGYAMPNQCGSAPVNLAVYVTACGAAGYCTSGFGGRNILGHLPDRFLSFNIDCPNFSAKSVAEAKSSTSLSGVSLIVCIRGFMSGNGGVYDPCDQLVTKYSFTHKLYMNWRDRSDIVAGPENAADPNPAYTNGDSYLGGLELPATPAHAKWVRQILNGTTPDFYVVVGHSYGGASAYFLATEAVETLGVPQPDLVFLLDPVFNLAADQKKTKYFNNARAGRYLTVNWFQRNGAWAKAACSTQPPADLCVGGLADVNPCGSVMNAQGVCDIKVTFTSSTTCQPIGCGGTDCKFFAQLSDKQCSPCGLWGCQYPKPGSSLISHGIIDSDLCLWGQIDSIVGNYATCTKSGTACAAASCPAQLPAYV